ncbi:MAG: hypothetical protein A3K61_00525 [Thaumarchaeota archaeon RBG_16_49_8]|nr:MAG: hypothetical protein A3K61_00525 [Thaumarchaeota archaeon RBG_16_49_8]
MEPYHKLRIFDKLILLVILSALLSSLSSVTLAGQNIWGNYIFATVAMVHGVAIISLVRKRGAVYDETL